MMDIYKKCENLEGLDVVTDIVSWPMFPNIAWKSLKVLSLHLKIEIEPVDFWAGDMDHDLNPGRFWRGDMDRYLPNLRELTIYISSSRIKECRGNCNEIKDGYTDAGKKLPSYLDCFAQFRGTKMEMKSTKYGNR